MIHALIEKWGDMSRGGRYALSGALLAAAAGLYFFASTIVFSLWAVGFVLLVCTFLGVGEDPDFSDDSADD